MTGYKKYAEEGVSYVLHTKIITELNDHLWIGSIYKKYSNPNSESSWGWETFAWRDDKIIYQYDVLDNAEDVVSLHAEIESMWHATGEI